MHPGAGKEIAAGLLKQGKHVVMACRNMQACEAARAELLQAHQQASAECQQLDLADAESIRSFAARTKQQLAAQGRRQVSVLVNNAGAAGCPCCRPPPPPPLQPPPQAEHTPQASA